jgi:ABC-type phosphate transport system permease subunit
MSEQVPAYGLRSLAVIDATVFGLFGLSFFMPWTGCGRRSFGAFSTFPVAMFPVLVWTCPRPARREERELLAVFGGLGRRDKAAVPPFIPR